MRSDRTAGLGVRAKLTFWNSGVLALALVAVGLTLRYVAATLSLDSIDRELNYRIRHMGSQLSSNWFEEGYPPVEPRSRTSLTSERNAAGDHNQSPLRAERDRPSRGGQGGSRLALYMMALFDRTGRPAESQLRTTPWDPAGFKKAVAGHDSYRSVRIDDESLRVYSTPLVRRGVIEGVAQTAEPLVETERALDQLTTTLLIMSPLSIIIAALGGAFLTDRALGHVREVTRAADQIGALNLADRLPVRGHDEFSHLTQTMNMMLNRIESAFLRQERIIEQQRRFTADASHELRTPLTVIQANTSLALSRPRRVAEYQSALAAADRAANQMNRIVQDLLLLARSDSGQLNLMHRPLPLVPVLNTVKETFERPGHAKIHIEPLAEPLCVLGDEMHVIRLFANLVENAVNNTPATGSIAIRAARAGRLASISVEDTGCGIGPEHLPYVCERFYRVDGSRSSNGGGSGLGLAICRSIVDAHLGSLVIDSAVGMGTTVRITLPIAPRSGSVNG